MIDFSIRRNASKLKYFTFALVMILALWLIFLVSITRQQSIYQLVGPNDNPYWNAAQFRTAADDFQASMFRYALNTEHDTRKLKFDYEILVSKYFIISQHSDSTYFAYQQPLYATTIEKLRESFARMDALMDRFPQGGPAVTQSILDELRHVALSYDQFVKAIGAADIKRRDAVLKNALRDREILLYSNIGVSLLYLMALLMFARSARNFEKAYETARQVAHTKQVFLGAINHELRNPLQTIVSATENISHSPLDREAMLAVLNIDRAVKHIETHMRDLTDFLKLDTNKISLDIEEIDLAEIVSRAARKFDARAAEKGLRLVATQETSATSFISDEQRVQQIVDNLVENSIKYSNHGLVEIRYGIDGRAQDFPVHVEISDEGIGMDKEKIRFLFSPFFQHQFPGNQAMPGYGMGLAVVRGLVQVLGGKIAVESEPGKGTAFRVLLPYESGPPDRRLAESGSK
ncbi:sensor histidine kinase [Burkholderia gladioli]|nr:HAMP domain-containing sensor histidine kinase [Burkholderia gladioli]AYQ87992.1 sensor histidine kinase [Burkholderia gladioli]